MKVIYIGNGYAQENEDETFLVSSFLQNEWIKFEEYSEENKDFSVIEKSNGDKILVPYEDPNQLNLF